MELRVGAKYKRLVLEIPGEELMTLQNIVVLDRLSADVPGEERYVIGAPASTVRGHWVREADEADE